MSDKVDEVARESPRSLYHWLFYASADPYICQARVMLMHQHVRELSAEAPIDFGAMMRCAESVCRADAIALLVSLYNACEIELESTRFSRLALDVGMQLRGGA
eukprot:gnl/TRDRNA2_/TRDRNA2_170836_c1_seq2.p3 gnl/TRDRNA2_/TRDRNA2_170836_c1~~gnl/TRDRNA2_/TRDRNA2_170836_c1_seq2.p3  ORF type:complete len:103 (-),score=7.88 gnl/TRDRNA2_/TRDRNA2_170836_c1_seq2:123-431(-)